MLKTFISPLSLAALVLTFAMVHSPLANVEVPSRGAGKAFRVRFGPGPEPSTLNPLVMEGQEALLIQGFVLESLMVPDDDTYDWRPALAESYRVAEDGRSIEYTLRSDALWADGSPVTAEDVRFTFAAIFDPRFKMTFLRPFYQSFAGVDVIDAHHVRFRVKQNYFGNLIQSASLKILPKHIYELNPNDPRFNDVIHGSGPYVVDSWQHGRAVSLRENPNWWGRQDPYWRHAFLPKRVSFMFVPDDNLALEMMGRGELDYAELGPATYTRLRASGFNPTSYQIQEVRNSAPTSVSAIALNLRDPLFSDRRVRLALNMMVDREAMIHHLYDGLAVKSTGPWYRSSPFADARVGEIPYDPARALRLLKEAGWRDDGKSEFLSREINGRQVPLRFTALAASNKAVRELTILKEDAARIGVRVDIRRIDEGSLFRALGNRDFQAVAFGEAGGWVDFDPKSSWSSAAAEPGGANFVSYRDPGADELITRIGRSRDVRERRPLMRELYARIAREVPYIYLLNDRAGVYAVSNRVGRAKPFYRYGYGLKFMYLREDRRR